jgi:hypothetical protein
MPSDSLNLIFDLAGAALILHLVLSTALRALLGRKKSLGGIRRGNRAIR